MPWSGKVLGGLFGAMLGGPVGAGVGAAAGHFFADSDAARKARSDHLHLQRLEWRHHAFSPAGPGMWLVPVWRARGLVGVGVTVTLRAGGWRASGVVEPEQEDEVCQLPELFAPYAALGEVEAFDARLEAGDELDTARFELELPNETRRLGSSGPARLAMAMVACARAARPLAREDVRFVRERFEREFSLDEQGQTWLRAWLRVLRDAAPDRLTPPKVARRLEPHVDLAGRERVVAWLLEGVALGWDPGWAAELAGALGVSPERQAALAQLVAPGGEERRREALATLGLEGEPTPDEVQQAWRRMVRLNHPDRAQSAEGAERATRRTAEINAAYDWLCGAGLGRR